MNRGRAQRRQRKLVFTVVVAGVTALLTILYAVAAPVDLANKRRADATPKVSKTVHDVDHSLHTLGTAAQPVKRAAAKASKKDGSLESARSISDLVEAEASPDAVAGDPTLPRTSELLAELGVSRAHGAGPLSVRSGSIWAASGRRGGAYSGSHFGGGGFSGASASAAIGGIAQGGFSIDPMLGSLDTTSGSGAGATTVANVLAANVLPGTQFRPGAPLPIGSDPCLRDGLVVSPCVKSSSELLQDIDSLPFVSGPGGLNNRPGPRLARFSNLPSGGGDNGGGSNDPTDDGGDGGGSNDPFGGEGNYTADLMTPVPAPSPVFLLSAGFMLLLRSGRR